MSIRETPSVVRDIVDNADERELWIVGREFERPPYFHAGKGGDTRLARALRVCLEGRVSPNSDGSYTVEGSDHRQYRVADSCSCPNSQQGKSRWCYHSVSVALYVEWKHRLRPTAPVVLGTLRVGTAPLAPAPDEDDTLGNGYPVDDDTLPLPLAPTSSDERLATVPAPTIAQEASMPVDESAYIPEPDVPPVAVVDVKNGISHETPLATPLASALVQWSAQRQVVKEFLRRELHAGVDYYALQIKGRDTKPVLSKAGSEKVLGLLQLAAHFSLDEATWTMLGKPEGTLCYVCTLTTTAGHIVGEGRGARRLTQDGGDLNKTIKMAQKSAQVDAVLRTGALSDCFTQDLDDEQTPEPATPARPSSSDLRQRIWALVKAADATITTREACESYVQRVTGLALEPDHYGAIVTTLEQGR